MPDPRTATSPRRQCVRGRQEDRRRVARNSTECCDSSAYHDETQMTKIHLIGGEKGGVGKSVVARLLAQYFIDHQIGFLGFDSDLSHGALVRFYAGYASPV